MKYRLTIAVRLSIFFENPLAGGTGVSDLARRAFGHDGGRASQVGIVAAAKTVVNLFTFAQVYSSRLAE